MKDNMEVIIFIHPWMWVKEMCTEAHLLGYKVLSVITNFEQTRIDNKLVVEESDFIFHGGNDPKLDLGNLSVLLKVICLKPIAVINGLDSAIYYADFIQKHLLYKEIDLNASNIRLNKYSVNETLMAANIAHINSVEITGYKELITKRAAIKKLGTPLVAKPSEDTAAMAGFEVLKHPDELQQYVKKYLGAVNKCFSDKTIQKAIVQSYISADDFTEYTFDFVSHKGKHECIGIGAYEVDQYGVSKGYYILDVTERYKMEAAIQYVRDCLDALNVFSGFTHNEVFWDDSDRILLVESNARHIGQPGVRMYHYAYERSALKTLSDLIVGRGSLNYSLNRVGYSHSLCVYNCQIDNPTDLWLKGLSSRSEICMFRGKNQPKNASDFHLNYDRFSQLTAVIILFADNSQQLKIDVEKIREREKNGNLFVRKDSLVNIV
jgi:hypothetical protein